MAAPASNTKAVPIHLLVGADEDAMKKAAQALLAKIAPSDPMNFETVDGRCDTADEAVNSIAKVRESILTLPFFGDGKLVWWKNVNFFGDTGAGRFESVKAALETLPDDLARVDGSSVTLLITAAGVHRGRTFGKALLKLASSRSFDLIDLGKTSEDEIIFQIERRMKEAGLHPGPGAAERFFQATGIDTGAWTQEIAKLACFLGDEQRELTLDDVNLVISGTREVLIWDFCDAVISGNAKAALALLSSLLGQEESEVGILIVLAGRIRLAALGGVLRENNLLRLSFNSAKVLPAGEGYLPRKKTGEPISAYTLGQVAQRSRERAAAFWFQALDCLYRAQKQMLTGQADKRRTLELAVLEIVAGSWTR
jgi:DNA polymerase-3 subunit delta